MKAWRATPVVPLRRRATQLLDLRRHDPVVAHAERVLAARRRLADAQAAVLAEAQRVRDYEALVRCAVKRQQRAAEAAALALEELLSLGG